MAERSNPETIVKTAKATESVVFKGYKNGLTLVIPEMTSLEESLEDIRVRLEQSQDFFKGAKIILDTGNRLLTDNERTSLLDLVKEFGLNPYFMDEKPRTAKIKASEKPNGEIDQFRATITVKKTVRSGQRIAFGGNLVIMGDVNPGAEVVASGDIVVLGTLRGTAHAGAEGDATAQIIAFQLKPVQIRIAGVITRDSEPERKSKYLGPEIAMIKDGMIVVERVSY
ncbi:MAG: septum site-determining protein MinC [Bacillota bacterium]